MKHTKMKGFTSIKSDDFEGKAVDIVDIVDIVDGDEVGWGHHQPLPIDENPITTQIINDAAAKDHKPAKTEVKMETGGPCLEDKGDNVASGDNTGWFYDVPFQHFGEQDTTILELDNSNDLSQYFTNSDDFLILELDDIIDCGGKVAPEATPEATTPETTPECTSETTSKTTVEVTLEVTLEGGTLNVGITVEAALEVASRVQTWFWGAQDSIDLAVM